MTGWRARLASFAGTWPMSLLIVALLSALAGFTVGAYHSTPPNTSGPANTTAVTNLTTPGGENEAEVSFEQASGHAFPHTKGGLPPPIRCPHSDDVTSELTTTVLGADSLVLDSKLHVTLNGVEPPRPPIDMNNWLQRPEGSEAFASCFIGTHADIASLTWADGQFDAYFDLKWDDTTGYTNDLLKPVSSTDHATLTVDICAPHPEWRMGVEAICQSDVKSTVIVRVKSPLRNAESRPFPNSQNQKDDYLNTMWRFDGPMPRLTVLLDAPVPVLARSWLHWNRTHNFQLPFHTLVSIDPYYIADSSAIWLALITAALLLRRKQISDKPLRADWRLLLVIFAGLLLGVQINFLHGLNGPYSNGFVVVASWCTLSVAVASKRMRRRIVALSVAALAPLVCLIPFPGVFPRLTDWEIYALLTIFGALLAVLIMAAAWALSRQIRTLADLTDPDGRATTLQLTYRRIIDALMIAAFLFALGFPVGETLNWWVHHQHIYPLGVYIANNLILSTGVRFRAALGWVSILLAISYLAGYLIHRSWRAIPPRATWTRLTRGITNRAVAAVPALLLCLSAPWTSRFALGVAIPVWVLQFAILWLALTLLIGNARQRQMSRPRGQLTPELVGASTGSSYQEGSPVATAAGDAAAQVTEQPAPVTSQPDFRQLVLAPRPWLGHGKTAAQIASIVAIIPVTYLMRTTLGGLNGQLSFNVGILGVALFAGLEFARWLVSGFLFGCLYAALPGRIGPVKALAFAGIWILSCLGPLAIAQGTGNSSLTHEVIYRGAQFALFAIVLAIVIDLRIVAAGGGTWRNLQDAYDLQNYGQVAAAITPAALLILTLAQQIKAGSGFQVANTLLTGITGVLHGPG